MRWLGATLTLAGALLGGSVQAAEPESVEVMILGAYHFANPGRDLVNIETDDVRTPRRQAELEALAEALAEWAPTRILVEHEAPDPGFHDQGYADYSEAMLSESRNETVQIGYRLAARLGHDHVYGFDEQGEEYFPFQAVSDYAEAHGMAENLHAIIGEMRAMAEAQSAAQDERSIPEALIAHNDPALVDPMHRRGYYGLFAFGDGEEQPGAELNAFWYMRNAKMFAKLDLIAEPGDRVLVIVGSGHGYWLRHFARETPGYELVDVLPYLRAAADVIDRSTE